MTGIRSSFVLLAMLALQAIGSAQATTSPAAPNRRPIVVAVDQTTPQPAGDAAVRRRAEDLATEASDRFSEILSKDEPSRSRRAIRATVELAVEGFDGLSRRHRCEAQEPIGRDRRPRASGKHQGRAGGRDPRSAAHRARAATRSELDLGRPRRSRVAGADQQFLQDRDRQEAGAAGGAGGPGRC